MKYIAALILAIGLIAPTFAADRLAFAAKEISVQTFAVAEIQDFTGAADFGGGLGVSYFVTRGLGIGARAISYGLDGTAVDQFGPRLTFRAPLWDTVAPYAYLDGSYNIGRDAWGAGAGGGIELRPFHRKSGFLQKLSLFGESGLHLETSGRGAVNFAAGVGLSF